MQEKFIKKIQIENKQLENKLKGIHVEINLACKSITLTKLLVKHAQFHKKETEYGT